MPSDINYNKLILSICRNEAALWLGPDWRPPDSPEERILLSEQDWLGIWSDSQEPETAAIISQNRKNKPFTRSFIEIPGAVDDILQPDFRYSEWLPFFYLNGRLPNNHKLQPAKQSLARLTKLAHIERLPDLTLIACGFSSPNQFANCFNDSFSEFLGRTKYIFVAGIDGLSKWESQLSASVSPTILGKFVLVGESLPKILRDISPVKQEKHSTDLSRQISVNSSKGKISLLLEDIIRNTSPVDQYFHIITASDIRPPIKSDNTSELVKQLLSNQRPCWRAFAHELEWRRPGYDAAKEKMETLLRQIEETKGEASSEVKCLDILGEPSSGFSVFLQWLAFTAAKQYYPTIFANEDANIIDYESLRRFLVDLEKNLVANKAFGLPIVIVLGNEVFANDSTGQMANLPRLLKREGHRVLLIRGTHRGYQKSLVQFDSRPIEIFSTLDQNGEIPALCNWAQKTCFSISGKDNEAISTIQKWQSSSQKIPLLVALDYVLTDDLREAGDFPNHLLKRLDKEIYKSIEEKPTLEAAEGIPIKTKDGLSILTLGTQKYQPPRPTMKHLAEILMTVSVLGRLRSSVPRSILESIINTDTDRVYQAIHILERSKLIRIELPENDRLKPRPFYDITESVRLLHDLYSDMLLRSFISGNLGTKLDVKDSSLCNEYLKILGQIDEQDQLPISLLGPLCQRFKAGNPQHISYAESLSMQYMRISYDDEDSFRSKLLRDRIDEILHLYSELPKAMIQDSVTLLHSQGLTYRWHIPLKRPALIGKDIQDCRNEYDLAANCLKKALALCENRVEPESPDNLRTSLGLVYRNRAITEMNHPNGDKNEWSKYLDEAMQCFDSVLKKAETTYAAHALADLKVRELEVNSKRKGSLGYDDVPRDRLVWFTPLKPFQIAEKLSEAFQLLSSEPEQRFEAIWNNTRTRALELLVSEEAVNAANILKDQKDEMGYVLDAMRQLKTHGISKIPDHPTAEPQELQGINDALNTLNEASNKGVVSCPHGNLLRYALFSSLESRIYGPQHYDPAYKKRYELIKLLRKADGLLYYDNPIWSYDYAMLAFQNGDIEEGQRMFRHLRATQLFRKIPWERSEMWRDTSDYKIIIEGNLKITKLDNERNHQGWGYFTSENYTLNDPIPFKIPMFMESVATTQIEVGKTVRCKVRLQPMGAYAIPSRMWAAS